MTLPAPHDGRSVAIDDAFMPVTRTRAAAVLRRLGHLFVERAIDQPLLDQIDSAARGLADKMAARPRFRPSLGDLADLLVGPRPGDGDELDHFPSCPVSGKENPLGLAVRVHRDGDSAVASATFEAGCAGMPGVVHGGPLAAVFDDLMGFVLTSLHGLSGYTATMTVSYRRPARIGSVVSFRSRLTNRDGRKIYIASTAHDTEGRLIAEASALFIEIALPSPDDGIRTTDADESD
jgi:acyl-coenzyme A thioesterase PaaI-like protein